MILPFVAVCIGLSVQAQKDTLVKVSEDTIKIGGIVIINKPSAENSKDWKTSIQISDSNRGELVGDFKKTHIKISRNKKALKNVHTSWLNWDLGFANYSDHSKEMFYIMNSATTNIWPSPTTPASSVLKLNNLKSSNVNVWLVQQKVNLYQHQWNVKYGVGFEMYNFRFEENVSFRNTYPNIIMDNVTFSKNKLFVKYLTIPLQLNFTPNPKNKKGFTASLGVSAGYLLKARNKQISNERGKEKINGNFNLNDWRLATIGEVGIGKLSIYGSFGLTNLFEKDNGYGFNVNPYAIGIRFR